MAQAELSLRRIFALSERMRLMLRVDLFNALNHPNFVNPDNTINTGTFGTSTGMLNANMGGAARL